MLILISQPCSQCILLNTPMVPVEPCSCNIFPYSSGLLQSQSCDCASVSEGFHDDVIKWKHFPRYWPFVRGIHRTPTTNKGQWGGALMFSLICAWTNSWVNNRKTGDLRRHHAHYDVTVMCDEWGKTEPYRTTANHNKARSVCIIIILCITHYWKR